MTNMVYAETKFKSNVLVKLNIDALVFEAAILDNAPYETTLHNWIVKSFRSGKSISETVILIQKTQRMCALKRFTKNNL